MSNQKFVVDELNRIKGLYIECPECGESFLAKRARLFSIKNDIPPKIQQVLLLKSEELDNQFRDIKDQRNALRKRKKEKPMKIKVTTATVNFGKIIEKIIPAFDSFPFDLRDCRALYEPIDYIIFNNLSNKGAVESIIFTDVKSGNAQLQDNQKQIKRLVENGKVKLTVMPNE